MADGDDKGKYQDLPKTDVESKLTFINKRWPIQLPEHRAVRPEWPDWEKERLDSMHKNIKKGDVVFDIGAEEGDLPALFALWGAEVVPFEPNPYVWPNIRFIWEANKLQPPRAYFAGFAANQTILHPKDVEPIFEKPEKDGWPACAYGAIIGDHGFRNETERYHDTPSIKLDDFCQQRNLYPDLITMDVEGAEFEVIKGAEWIIKNHRPLVYISIHPEFMKHMYPYDAEALHGFFKEAGYDSKHLITDHEEHWVFWPAEKDAPK